MTNISDLTAFRVRCQQHSEMVRRYAERFPDDFDALTKILAQHTHLDAIDTTTLRDTLRSAQNDEMAFVRTLRIKRWREHVRLACADMVGKVSPEAMLVALSDLAQCFLQVTYEYCYAQLVTRFGTPMSRDNEPQHLTIFGMGKLGGRELNFSSDIDLIALFDQTGDTVSEQANTRSIDNALFFHKLMQKLILLLDKRDANGFVYRVDMRLKPFGQVGSLVSTFAATRDYYHAHGRHWERYALVKMRPVAGDIDAGNAFLESMQSWVYPRTIDFDALTAIDDMKQQVLGNLSDEGLTNNIKLGAGGIRDIEFIVQTKQIMYGGRIHALRGQSLLAALDNLVTHDILNRDVVDKLRQDYFFLRRAENAIQYYADQQTHDLPNETHKQLALYHALSFENWQSLSDTLRRVRYDVSTQFSRIFARQTDSVSDDASGIKSPARGDVHDVAFWQQRLVNTNIEDPDATATRLVEFYQQVNSRADAERYLARLDWVMPLAIKALSKETAGVTMINRFLTFLDAIVDKNVYISLIIEHPDVLATLLRLMGASEWLHRFICEHPFVIDELIHEQFETTQKTAKQTHADLAHAITQAQTNEQKTQQLIAYKNAQVFRIASADLRSDMNLMEVSDHLTWVAEAICASVLEMASQEMQVRYGKPTYELGGNTFDAGFGMIGYGKFGGIEMGYNSDLDLLFLYHSTGEQQVTDGEQQGLTSIANEVYFTKLVQKITKYLTTGTANGRMYDVDQRLRPSGNAGLPVSNLSAFEHYQQHDAWVWEHQALVRSRFICGDENVRKGFNAIRQMTLCQSRDEAELRDAVLTMREKMRENQKQFADFNLKHDSGGVIDIEFIVQYLILLHAKNFRHLVRCSDNIRQISALELFDIIASSRATECREIYRKYRERIHHAQLRNEPATVKSDTFSRERQVIERFWADVFEEI